LMRCIECRQSMLRITARAAAGIVVAQALEPAERTLVRDER
jgi:hypothetical protein